MNPLIHVTRAIPPSAHLLRDAFYLLLLVGVCATPFALAQPNATRQSLAKLGSASKGFVGVGNALPANIIVVTNTNDNGPGSLRDALAVAKDGDTIDATGVSGTILLTSGELQITHNVTINGPSSGNLAVDGNVTSRVFENFAADVTISSLTITNGLGGILNHGGLALTGTSTLNNHLSEASGGGIYNDIDAQLTVMDSTISGNVGCWGGGIYNRSAQLAVINSTVSGNASGPNSNCDPSSGGGIYNDIDAELTVIDSTMSDNVANFGSAIYNLGTTTIGDAILNRGLSGDTILAGGTVTSLGYNLASDDAEGVLTGPADQINTDPLLGPLQDNGGPTLTHALLPSSPAINAGDPNFTPPPFYDQRGPGYPRISNGRIDVGSFEAQAPRVAPTPRPRPTPHPRPTP